MTVKLNDSESKPKS